MKVPGVRAWAAALLAWCAAVRVAAEGTVRIFEDPKCPGGYLTPTRGKAFRVEAGQSEPCTRIEPDLGWNAYRSVRIVADWDREAEGACVFEVFSGGPAGPAGRKGRHHCDEADLVWSSSDKDWKQAEGLGYKLGYDGLQHGECRDVTWLRPRLRDPELLNTYYLPADWYRIRCG